MDNPNGHARASVDDKIIGLAGFEKVLREDLELLIVEEQNLRAQGFIEIQQFKDNLIKEQNARLLGFVAEKERTLGIEAGKIEKLKELLAELSQYGKEEKQPPEEEKPEEEQSEPETEAEPKPDPGATPVMT